MGGMGGTPPPMGGTPVATTGRAVRRNPRRKSVGVNVSGTRAKHGGAKKNTL